MEEHASIENRNSGSASAGDAERRGRRTDRLVAALLFLAVLLQGGVAIRQVGISWDEPDYYRTAKEYVTWAENLSSAASFTSENLQATFGFRPHKNDHPTLAKIVSALTYVSLKGPLGEFWAYRFSGPLLFAVLLSVLYLRLARSWSRPAALASVMFLATMPHFYTHSHIAATDAPLSVFWLLAVVAFERSTERRGLWPLAGLAYGLCMSVKFTGFLLPLPLLAWGLLYRRRYLLRPALGLLIGPAVFLLLQPAMWHHPLSGIVDFVRMSASREQWNPHWVLFLGRIYDFSGPWYYAPFLIVATVPESTLLLSIVGVLRSIRERFKDSVAGSSLIHFGFFMAITMAPAAPTFDGDRLFLPAVVFLALLAGYGLEGVVRDIGRLRVGGTGPLRRHTRLLGPAVAVVSLFLAAVPLFQVYPYGLEYYSSLVGGVKGARMAGLETTYWWTALTERHLTRINQLLPPKARLRFVPMDPDLHQLYASLGLLRKDIQVVEGNDFDYAVVLSRPYWNYARLFEELGVPRSRLNVVGALARDQVPFWVLYRR